MGHLSQYMSSKTVKVFISLLYLVVPLLQMVGFDAEAYVMLVALLFLAVYRLDVPGSHYANINVHPSKLSRQRIHFALSASAFFVILDQASESVYNALKSRGTMAFAMAFACFGLAALLYHLYVEWPSFQALKTDKILLSKFLALTWYTSFLGLGGSYVMQFIVFPLIAFASLFREFPDLVNALLAHLQIRGRIWEALADYQSSKYYHWLPKVPAILVPLLLLNARFLQIELTVNIETSLSIISITVNQWQVLYMGLLVSAVLLPLHMLIRKATLTGVVAIYTLFLSSIVIGVLHPSAVPITAFIFNEFHLSDPNFIFEATSILVLGFLLYSSIISRVDLVLDGLLPIDDLEVDRCRKRITIATLTLICFLLMLPVRIAKQSSAGAFYVGSVMVSLALLVLSGNRIEFEHALPIRFRTRERCYLLRGFFAAGLGSFLLLFTVPLAGILSRLFSYPAKDLLFSGIIVSTILAAYQACKTEKSKRCILISEGIVSALSAGSTIALWYFIVLARSQGTTLDWTRSDAISSVGLLVASVFLGTLLGLLHGRLKGRSQPTYRVTHHRPLWQKSESLQ